MANIKQQKKRVGIAARQRLENLRYKSAARTLFKRLQAHVDVGEKDDASTVHRELVRVLDKAATRNVLHRNTAARKKSRAARILESEPVIKETARRQKSKKPTRKPKAAAAADAATTSKAKSGAATKDTAASKDTSAKKEPAATKEPAAKKESKAEASKAQTSAKAAGSPEPADVEQKDADKEGPKASRSESESTPDAPETKDA